MFGGVRIAFQRKQQILAALTITGALTLHCAPYYSGDALSKRTNNSPKHTQKKHDLVVIGGGVVGSSVALFAKKLRPSADVVLIDGESIAAGASAHSAGTLWIPQVLSDVHDVGNIKRLNPTWDEVLASATLDVYRMLEVEGYDCELKESGAVVLAGSKKEASYVGEIFLDLATRGYDVRDKDSTSNSGLEIITTPSDFLRVEPRLNPENVLLALHLPASAHIDPLKSTQALANAAEATGVVIREGSPVKQLSRSENGSWLLTLSTGESIETDRVVLACGATISRLYPRGKVIVPVKGQIVQSEGPMPQGWLKKIIFSASAHADFASGEANSKDEHTPPECTHNSNCEMLTRHLYGRQRADGYVIFGGGRIPQIHHNTKGLDYAVDKKLINGVVGHASELIMGMQSKPEPNFDNANAWSCFMPFSIDGKPFVGELSDSPGLYCALGFGPEGMTWGPGAAHILALQIWKEKTGGSAKKIPFADRVEDTLSPNGRM